MSKSTRVVREAEVAKQYQETRNLLGFEGGSVEPIEVRRNVTISVRFSDEEMDLLRARAEASRDEGDGVYPGSRSPAGRTTGSITAYPGS